MALVLVLGLTLAMAAPVAAQVVDSVVIDFWPDLPGVTNSRGAITYTIRVQNENLPGATAADVTVTFYPPGPTGAIGDWGDAVPIDTRRIEVGETVYYNWNGEGWEAEGGAIAHPALQVWIPLIPLNEGVDTVYARCEMAASYVPGPHSGGDHKNVPAGVIWPDTKVTIEPSEKRVASGDSVTLTITEENTGEQSLTDVYVEVWKNGTYLLDTLDHTTPGWICDGDEDDVLDVGETWTWIIDSGPLTSTTEFVALGFGRDPLGLEVSYDEGFEDERHEVTIQVDHPVGGVSTPVSRLALIAPWIVLAGLIAGAAVFVWSRRAQSRA